MVNQKVLLELTPSQVEVLINFLNESIDPIKNKSDRQREPESEHVFGAKHNAAFLGCAESTVYNNVGKQNFPVKNQNGRLIAKKADLIDYLNGEYKG